MKNVFIVSLLLAVLAGCTKSMDSGPDTKVVYKFTGNVNATYNVTYTEGSGAPVRTSFSGTSWSKTISTYRYTGFTRANFTVNAATPNPAAVGSMDIIVNDTIVLSQSNLTFNNSNQGYFYYVDVFK